MTSPTAESNVLTFPLHRVRLRNNDEQWAMSIAPVFAAHKLTEDQRVSFVKYVDAYRFDHPHAHPSPALAFDLFDSFTNEHLIREGAGCTYIPCQICGGGVPGRPCTCYTAPRYPYIPPVYSSPVGCICPPTSEKTCQNPNCPCKAPEVPG